MDATNATTCAPVTDFPDAFPVAPRAVSEALRDGDEFYRSLTMYATVDGQLQVVTTSVDTTNGTPVYQTLRSTCGTGWGSMRTLVGTRNAQDNPMLYALHDNGRLYRYKRLNLAGCHLQSAGSVALPGLKTIAPIGEHPDKDVFLITTTSGSLSVLRIPRTTAMTATSSQIRARSWQGFDGIHFRSGYGSGLVNQLVGINNTTHRRYNYKLEDATKGLATVMVADGSVDATAVGPAVFTGDDWDTLTGG